MAKKIINSENIIMRRAELDDLEAIIEIYNYAIINTEATFDTEPKTVESRLEWFNKHNDRFPIIIAENNKGSLLGWASLSEWSDRCAYSNTAEVSVYIDRKYWNNGIGSLLMSEICKSAYKNKLHTILARIAGDNKSSIHLHSKFGFEYIGTMKEVGYKFNRFIDVHMMQLMLEDEIS